MHARAKPLFCPRQTFSTAHADGVNVFRKTDAAAAAGLSGFVLGYTGYWERTAGFTSRRELPSLNPVLIVNLGAAIHVTGGDGACVALQPGQGFLAGLHDRHAVSASAGSQAGIHVWLTMRGFQHLLGGAAGETANRAVRLSGLSGAGTLGMRLLEARSQEERFALLDRTLADLIHNGRPPPAELAWAFARIRRNPGLRMEDLAGSIGWSRKRLTARFQARYGLTPKVAARVARFERVIAASAQTPRPDWAGIAADAGYFDQGHMIRDFSALAGLTPAAYVRRLLPGAGLIEG